MVYLIGIHVALLKHSGPGGHQGSEVQRFRVLGSATPLAAQSDRVTNTFKLLKKFQIINNK
jgi:hypothetical protein